MVFHFNSHFKFYINRLMKIHEDFHVKGIFQQDKSNRMKVYTCIYLVCFSGLQDFVPLETNAFTFRLFSVSIYFKFRISGPNLK